MVAIGDMSKAFYRKYRSKNLSEVVGQSHITDILSRALADDKVAHAYLFTGPRGVGKTSVARILAHEINKLPYDEDGSHLDIIEIDAASNNGVEDIRDLRERVQLAPVSAAKKVYIIDEVHMLSKAAFNALLKTLEEPPEHIVFILATTDADKLPATIISRTQRFNFRSIPTAEAAAHLAWIAEQEGFTAEDEALRKIAVHGEGSFRDSISLLDQLHTATDAKAGITGAFVESFLGLPPTELVEQLLAAYEANDLGTIVTLLDGAEHTGIQPTALAAELIRSIRAGMATRPQLLPLLDKLLEVAGSSRPDIKLLTALAPAPQPVKSKAVALASPVPVVSAPIAALKKSPPEASTHTVATETLPAPAAEKPPKKKTTPQTAAAAPFDWDALVSSLKGDTMALFTMLSKCGYTVDGPVLTIYAGNAFYKKKLDDARHRASLAAALETLGMGELTIETVASVAPPKDETAASVAAIMGGGVEVALEEGAA